MLPRLSCLTELEAWLKMKQDQLKAWQPEQFDHFVRILELDPIHAYLFRDSLEAWKWRSFGLRASFVQDKVGVHVRNAETAS